LGLSWHIFHSSLSGLGDLPNVSKRLSPQFWFVWSLAGCLTFDLALIRVRAGMKKVIENKQMNASPAADTSALVTLAFLVRRSLVFAFALPSFFHASF